MKISAIQMCSSLDVKRNLAVAEKLIAQAAGEGTQMVVLPEMFALVEKGDAEKQRIKETFGEGPIQECLANAAQKHQVWIVGGTIPIVADRDDKVRAACLLYNSHGEWVTRYDKIHLFDVILSAEERYEESASVEPGNQIICVDTPVGRLGLAVCYDLRFPEMFRYMFNQGVEIFAIPAAFTMRTGQAHWEVLTRARAIENFSYVVGACQGGLHASGRKTYGHSLITDPWGQVTVSKPEGVGVISAEIDLSYLRQVRERIPVKQHQTCFIDVSRLER